MPATEQPTGKMPATEQPTGKMPAPRSHRQPGCPAMKGLGLRRPFAGLRYKSATTRVATCGVAFLRLHFQTVPPSGVRLALTAKLSSYYQARGVFRKQSVSILFRLAERKGAQWQ